MKMMKKASLAVVGALTTLVATAVPALAQYDVGGSNDGPEVLPDVIVRAPQELAFTGGSNLALLVALAAVALAIGVEALLASRRIQRSAA
jgi:hypothetical protein